MKPTNTSAYLREFINFGRLKSVPVIDTHTHMGSVYGVSSPVCEIEDCLRLMDEENIRMIWCAAHGDLFAPDAEDANGVTRRLAERYPQRVKGYYVFNPNHADLYEKHFQTVKSDSRWIGFKVLPNYHNRPLDAPCYENMLRFAEENRLIVLSHTWGVLPHNSTREVAHILERHPDLYFIIGHSAPGECREAIALAKKYPHVYLDLCDIHRHSGIIDAMAEGAGTDKILFGTDLPWYDPNYCIGSVLCANITDEDREKIFFRNAEKILQELNKQESCI